MPGSDPVPLTPPAPPMPPPTAWLPDGYHPDVDLRIEALGVLIRTDAKVIPMLREIAVDADNPGDARRAIFVLMQSGRPEARDTVFQVAKAGPEAAQLAAIRELGRFGGQQAFDTLLQVYEKANVVVKNQVVTSLGAGAQRVALVKIAESEKDPHLRDTAIVTLGRAGGGEQLRVLYQRGGAEIKRPIIVGLFTARQEDTLIRIADEEKDPVLRAECLRRLRLLGTPRARAYLQKVAPDR
jgi:HEAT repeats